MLTQSGRCAHRPFMGSYKRADLPEFGPVAGLPTRIFDYYDLLDIILRQAVSWPNWA